MSWLEWLGAWYITVGMIWMLILFGLALVRGPVRISFRGQRAYGLTKFIAIVFLSAYVFLLWPVSLYQALFGDD